MDRDRSESFEGRLDESVPMPRPAVHKVCTCGKEHFEETCPDCAERDRLAEAQFGRKYRLVAREYASIPGGTLNFAGPFGAPDRQHLVEGDYPVKRFHEEGGLTWACLVLEGNEETWVKVGPKFGVTLYKKHTRPKTSH